MMSERQKDRIVKLVRELLKETPTRVAAVEKLRAAIAEVDEKELRRRAHRRAEQRAYVKQYGFKEGWRRWRQANCNIVYRPRGKCRRRR